MEKTKSFECCKERSEKEKGCYSSIISMVNFVLSLDKEQKRVKEYSPTQCRCFIELRESDCMNMNKISSNIGLDKSTMTRIIDKMVKQDLIVRRKDENDKRIVNIELSEKGEEASVNVVSQLFDFYHDVYLNIPAEKRDTVLESLNVFKEAIRKTNDKTEDIVE